ncbi:MAG: hypothetical protein ABH828_01585 [archaeon]
MYRNKKAQMWISDFIIGFLIFTSGLILASRFIFNSMQDNNFAEVRMGAETISEYFLSEGVPSYWTNETVVRIGLTTNNRLNLTKLSYFYNMSYDDTRTYLSTKYDYIVFFKNSTSTMNLSSGCGQGAIQPTDCDYDISGIVSDNFVKLSRYTIHNNSIIEMVLYVWD